MATDQTRRSLAVLAIMFAALCVLSVVARGPRIVDDVAALSRDPQALQRTLRACRMRMGSADDPACRAASEAWRRQFFGNVESTARTSHVKSAVRSRDLQTARPTPLAVPLESLSAVPPSRLIEP